MSHRNQIDRIEQYHTGSMSVEEEVLFEAELAADPSLRAESDFQGEIINGLKQYRKTQLKSRLEAIDLAPGWLEFAQQSALVKSFGGIAIASAIGTGVYFVAEKSELAVENDKVVLIDDINAPFELQPIVDWSIERADVIEEELDLIKMENQKASVVSKTQERVNASNASNNEALVQEDFTPSFIAPEADLVEENDIVPEELDEVETVTTSVSNDEPIDIETVISKSNKIRYKYYDGKLYLNGNFNDQPYEIIEINGAKGRRIYLLHNRKYYEVKSTDRLTELPEVRNIKLIQELRLLKGNK